MFEMPNPVLATAHGALRGEAAQQPPATRYTGPERRAGAVRSTQWFIRMLDEIDYGMLLLNERLEVLHANHVARAEMDAQHPLQLHWSELRACRPQDVAPLHDALQSAARRGLRRLFSVGEGAHSISIAVVPLAAGAGEHGAAMLVVFGKREMCGELSVQWFARNHSLTHAETRVLAALCAGRDPSGIASSLGVSLHTIRTQIGSVRAKTGAVSIRELIRQVSMLPPLVPAIRGASLFGHDRAPPPMSARDLPLAAASQDAACDALHV